MTDQGETTVKNLCLPKDQFISFDFPTVTLTKLNASVRPIVRLCRPGSKAIEIPFSATIYETKAETWRGPSSDGGFPEKYGFKFPDNLPLTVLLDEAGAVELFPEILQVLEDLHAELWHTVLEEIMVVRVEMHKYVVRETDEEQDRRERARATILSGSSFKNGLEGWAEAREAAMVVQKLYRSVADLWLNLVLREAFNRGEAIAKDSEVVKTIATHQQRELQVPPEYAMSRITPDELWQRVLGEYKGTFYVMEEPRFDWLATPASDEDGEEKTPLDDEVAVLDQDSSDKD